MRSITAGVARTLDAPAADVYDVLADYRNGHPHILPEKFFSDLVVEEGGRGAGTVIRFRMHLLGGTREARAVVEEPVPGRVITEAYPENGAVTTFDVRPRDGGQRTQLTITTSWEASGIRGLVESWIMPRVLRKIFQEEMSRIEQHVTGQLLATPER
jgi:hypothetical protein